MRWVKVAYIAAAVASVAMHVAAFGGLSVLKKIDPGTQRVAVMMSAPKKKAKAKPPEPPKPIEAPKEVLQHPLAAPKAAPPPPVAPPPDPVAAAHPALAAMPDFGISLSGSAGPGGGGIAIPMGGAAAPTAPAAVHKEKVFGAAAERPTAGAADDCQEDLVKAKPQGFVQPTYTDDARAAGIEGRVRVEVTIDSSGAVLGTKIVSGLGHGLDESAIAAAKRMSFNAATRCGKAVQSTFVISMRFVLGE
jgi:protein TonB